MTSEAVHGDDASIGPRSSTIAKHVENARRKGELAHVKL